MLNCLSVSKINIISLQQKPGVKIEFIKNIYQRDMSVKVSTRYAIKI